MAAALYDALRSMLRRSGSVRFRAMRWRRGGGAARSGALRRVVARRRASNSDLT